MRGLRRRERIFLEGSAALSSLGLSGEVYACPLCRTAYARDAILDGTLTLEDVPPRSVGGRPLVLSCKACNNRFGYSVDFHLAEAQKHASRIRGLLGQTTGNLGEVVLKIGDAKVRVGLSNDGLRTSFSISDKHNDPKNYAHFRQSFDKIGKGDSINVEIESRASRMGEAKARVKSAFLFGFAKFGYGFALHDDLDWLHQALHEKVSLDFTKLLVRRDTETREGIYVSPEDRIFIVFFLAQGVALPLPGKASDDFFRDLESIVRGKRSYLFLDLPKRLEAILDLNKPGDFLLRSEAPSNTQEHSV